MLMVLWSPRPEAYFWGFNKSGLATHPKNQTEKVIMKNIKGALISLTIITTREDKGTYALSPDIEGLKMKFGRKGNK